MAVRLVHVMCGACRDQPLVAVDIWQGMSPQEREFGVETGLGNGVAQPADTGLRLGELLGPGSKTSKNDNRG